MFRALSSCLIALFLGCGDNVAESTCTPSCSLRECGPDGCNGVCGTCGDDQTCTDAGQCTCAPDCDGRECGDDSCGGLCSPGCSLGVACNSAGQCEVCIPDCDGRVCGDDGCGGLCSPGCVAGTTACNDVGQCEACSADCAARECGTDGCGGTCVPGCAEGGICNEDGVCDNYGALILYSNNGGRATYLVDLDGNLIHQWNHDQRGGYSVYLSDNGNIVRPAQATITQINGGASAGLIEEIAPDGTVLWQYSYNNADHLSHHDVEPMPNGNVLLIAWEVISAADATAAGRTNAREMWPDHLVEIQPVGTSDGNIVWEWHAWNHLIQDSDPSKDNYGVVADHPERLDVNLGASTGGPPGRDGDWLHINGVNYNAERDEIVISSHFMDEIYVIDHSTVDYANPAQGIAAAAGTTGGDRGKGGDILYRWGNPQNYSSGEQVFYVVHCSTWVPAGLPGAGNIMVFNNGNRRPGGDASSIDELTPPYDKEGNYILSGAAWGPTDLTWTYFPGSEFFSNHLGGLQRLQSGNTLVVESTSAYLFEVTAAGDVVWTYQAVGNEVARALRYEVDHPGIVALLGQ